MLKTPTIKKSRRKNVEKKPKGTKRQWKERRFGQNTEDKKRQLGENVKN
jgi:hypothetical protein